MMQQIHSDIATDIPHNFELLGYSEKTPIQGLVKFYDEDARPPAFTHSESHTLPAEPWRNVHIIAFQGEFSGRSRGVKLIIQVIRNGW
jgi:hypothetical protein